MTIFTLVDLTHILSLMFIDNPPSLCRIYYAQAPFASVTPSEQLYLFDIQHTSADLSLTNAYRILYLVETA